MGLRRIIRDMRAGWRADEPTGQALIASKPLNHWVASGTWHPPYAAIVCESFGHTLPSGTFPLKCVTCGQMVHATVGSGGTRT